MEHTVLVVDDDEAFARTVEIWLESEWSVRVAHDGDEAVNAYDPDVDVVLLDRRMPSVSGDEALEAIRKQEGEAGIAMMTAVSPSEDAAEMDFDMYLQKPVGRETALDAVETLQKRAQYPPEIRTLFGLRSKLETIRITSPDSYAERDCYQRLRAEFEKRYEEANALDELDDSEAEKLRAVAERDC